VVALQQVDAAVTQEAGGLLVLDPFGDDRLAQVVAERDSRGDDPARGEVRSTPGQEAAVQLHLVDRDGAQLRQGRVPRPEVVERRVDALVTERGEDRGRLLDVAHDRGLGDLQQQRRRREPVPVEGVADRLGQPALRERPWRQVDRHP
jgi:hypothetical protein